MYVVLIVAALAAGAFASQQAVGVRGQLMCGNQPLSATVKLWDLDTWPNPDNLLATVQTDQNGNFQIQGTESAVFTIDPVIRIYHTCNNRGIFNIPNLCDRESQYAIPNSYISTGTMPTNYYQFGTVNMEAKQPGETTHCYSSRSLLPGRK